MKLQVWIIMVFCCIGFSACKDRTAIENDLRMGVTDPLVGEWVIEEIEFEFQDSYYQKQVGLNSDTTFLDFGEVEIEAWGFGESRISSESWNTTFKLLYKDQVYNYAFEYLLINSYDEKISSQIFRLSGNDGDYKDFFLGLGFEDNFDIVKEGEEEFVFTGFSRGIKKMVWRRK